MTVAVIGGGVVGLACAYALVERGVGVVLLERAALGSGASRGNTGWVVPSLSMPLASPGMLSTGVRSALDPRGALVIRPRLDTEWIRWLWQFGRSCSLERFRAGVAALVELNRRTFEELDAYSARGVEFETHSTGILVVAKSPTGLAWFSTLFDELARAGFGGSLEKLTGDEARALEPALNDSVACAMRTVVDRHIQPESLMRGLAQNLRAREVAIHEGVNVMGLTRTLTGWRLKTDSELVGQLEAETVVFAAGSATRALLGSLGVRLPLVGAKGYSVDLRGDGEPPACALYLNEAKIGLSPFRDGVRIAGVFELPARSDAVSARRIEQLIEDAASYMSGWRPTQAEAIGRGWAGLRPATPDGLPLLGPIAGAPGVLVATGHGMLGVTLAPATGAVIAEIVTSNTEPDWLAPFRPDRRI